MNKHERTIIIILRILGISALFAIPPIFFPYSWMNAIHDYLGLGEMPDTPIVSYLARSLSALYAAFGGMILLISTDVRRYRSLVFLWSIIFCLLGGVLFGIDLLSGMPASWTYLEGPPAIALGVVMYWLQRHIAPVHN